eukprot:g7012.t1
MQSIKSPILFKNHETASSYIDSQSLERKFENTDLYDADATFLFDQHVLESFKTMQKQDSQLPTRPKATRNIWNTKSPRRNHIVDSTRDINLQKKCGFGRTIRTPSSTKGTKNSLEKTNLVNKKIIFTKQTTKQDAASTPTRKDKQTTGATLTPKELAAMKEEELFEMNLSNMKKMNKRVGNIVRLDIRQASIPAIQNNVTKLSQKYRELHSKRMYLEEAVQHAIQQVRANRMPDKWSTEFWDDRTGMKLTMGYLEHQENSGESKIKAWKSGEIEQDKKRLIYKNMLERTKKEKHKLRFEVGEIKHMISKINNSIHHQNVKLRKTLEKNSLLEVKIRDRLHSYKVRQLEHEGVINYMEAELDEKRKVIGDSIDSDKRRINITTEAREKAKGILTTKINIEQIESMKSKSVRGWLSQAKKASQPIMIAVKLYVKTSIQATIFFFSC